MAQLSDDCFASNGPLMPVADAERLIAERVTPVDGREIVTLREAVGRVPPARPEEGPVARASRGQGHDHHRRRWRHGSDGGPDVRCGGRPCRVRRRHRGDGRVGRSRRHGRWRPGHRHRRRRVARRRGKEDGRPRRRHLRPRRRPVQQRRDHARGRQFTRKTPTTQTAMPTSASGASRSLNSPQAISAVIGGVR